MVLNLSLAHFQSFLMMAAVAWVFFSGDRRLRIIGASAMWQLLTPTRDMADDLALFYAFCFLHEMLFIEYKNTFK